MPTHRSKFLPRSRKLHSVALMSSLVAVVAIGSYLVHASQAAGAFVATEPENGSISTPAIKLTDSSASGGSAVQFKSGGTADPTYVKGFDNAGVSTGTGNNYTAAQWQLVKDAGFKMYLTDPIEWGSQCADDNCAKPNNTCTISTGQVAQIQMAYNAGINYGIYTRNPNCLIKAIQGLSATLQANLSYALIDIEETPGVPVTQSLINQVVALGQTPVIYSYQGAWQSIMNNSTAFSQYALMDNQVQDWNLAFPAPYPSGYPTIPNMPNPYGGWSGKASVIVQQQANAQIPGIPGANNCVDLDSVSSAWLNSLPHHF